MLQVKIYLGTFKYLLIVNSTATQQSLNQHDNASISMKPFDNPQMFWHNPYLNLWKVFNRNWGKRCQKPN